MQNNYLNKDAKSSPTDDELLQEIERVKKHERRNFSDEIFKLFDEAWRNFFQDKTNNEGCTYDDLEQALNAMSSKWRRYGENYD